MTETKLRRQLPDHEETLRKNARHALPEAGVPPGKIDAEFERLRKLPFLIDIPTDAELDEMAARRAVAKSAGNE